MEIILEVEYESNFFSYLRVKKNWHITGNIQKFLIFLIQKCFTETDLQGRNPYVVIGYRRTKNFGPEQ